MTYEEATEDYDACIPLAPWLSDAERMRLMQADIEALKCEREELIEALRPFADVADHDIGESESDNDRFRPMFALNAAPPLLVGHLRRAATLLSRYGR